MKKNSYMGVWISSMILMLGVGVLSYIRGTYADFNGLTGNISIPLVKVNYSSNYPDALNINETLYMYSGFVNSTYFIEKNMFEVPSGYVFYSWNTNEDGSGDLFKEGKFHRLEENLNLYAIWGTNILGDINLDSVVDENDAELLNRYVSNSSFSIPDVVTTNSDVNLDGKIDLVDVDIIKQACLGTDGYKELLSNEPVFIYELYKPVSDNNNNSNNNNNNNNNSNNNNNNNNNSNNNNNNNDNNNDNGGDGTSSNGSISNNGGDTSLDNGGNNNSINPGVNNNKHDDIDSSLDKDDEKIDNNNDNKKEENSKSKSYLWVFILGICFISCRIIIDIIKKTVKKK